MDETKNITCESNLRRFLPAVASGPYAPEMKQTLAWVISYAADHNWTLGDIAAQAGVSTRTMRGVLTGTYAANAEPHLQSLAALRARVAEEQTGENLPFVETKLARYTMDLAEFTRRYHYAAVMIGPTQWGKTEAVKEYARRHPDKVVLVRCPPYAAALPDCQTDGRAIQRKARRNDRPHPALPDPGSSVDYRRNSPCFAQRQDGNEGH
mgnify:CR=1 FL=1